MLLVSTVIWGSAFVSQSVAMAHIGPFSFQAIRCFLGFLIMLPIIYILDKATGKHSFLKGWQDKTLWKAGILCGIPLFLACNLQQLALVDTDAGKSGFLTAMYIVFVPILGIFRKQKPSPLVPVSVMLAVAGLYLLSCVGVTSIQTGDLFLIGCAVMFAVQINVVDRDTLLEAQKNPELHRNLIVRVWGWSGYFVELDKVYQDHIIQRAELNL